MTLQRVAVFAGESELASPEEVVAARRVGDCLAGAGITMICSGDALGLIGVAIEAAVRAGGQVVGVAPDDQPDHRIHPALSELRRVRDRQQQRAELTAADAYIALPDAFATFDQVLAVLAGGERREIPIGLVDEGGAYSALLERAGDQTLDRFVRESQRGLIVMTTDVADLVNRLRDYGPPETRRRHAGSSD